MHRIPQAGRLVNIPLARRLSPPSRAVHTRHELYSSIIFDEQAASTFRISTCHCSPPPNRGFLRWLGCSEGASSYEKIVTSRVWSTGVTRSSFLLPPAGQQSVLAIVSSSQAEVPQDLLSLPKLIVPFSALTDLVPFTVLYDTLPFLKFTLAEFPAAPRAAPDAIPRWDTWLEQWYQMFHPATWTCLEQDNQADVNKIDEISPLLVAAAKGPEGIKGKRAQELATLLELLYKRCTSRFIALYALHVTRKTYFERKKVQLLALRTALGETATATELEGDILRDLERADEGAAMLPPFEPGSVWPFTTPAPIPHSAHDPPAPKYTLAQPTSSFFSRFFALQREPLTVDRKRVCIYPRPNSKALENLADWQRQKDALSASKGVDSKPLTASEPSSHEISRRAPYTS